MTLPFVVAQYINCGDYWWVWPCWFSSFQKLAIVWGGVALVIGFTLSRIRARARS